MKKNKFVYALLLALLLTVILGLLLYFKIQKSAEHPTFVLEDNIEIFERSLRSLHFLTGTEFIEVSADLTGSWQEIKKNYPVDPPQIYARTKNWGVEAWQIMEDAQKTRELAQENDFVKALEFLRLVEHEYLAIKDSNGLADFSQDFYDFYLETLKLEKAGNKAEIEALLPDFKLFYTNLKEKYGQYSQTQIMQDIEATIETINQQLDGPELQAAQKTLPEQVKELYLNN